jgi:opacity protein-like surface antigen
MILFVPGFAAPVQAQNWKHTLTPYLWGASMSGTTAVGPVSADVDVSFGTILENLKIGGMVSYRGENDRWAVLLDAIYMDLEADKSSTAGPVHIDTTVAIQQTALEADVGYRLTERTLAFVGLRYNDIQADLDLVRTGPGAGGNRSADTGESWVDPVIGVIAEIPFNDSWSMGLRGDVGGFGIGSDMAWQAMVTVRWQLKETMHLIGGYRYIDMDYENGSDASLFEYDMALSGPSIGVAFIF